MKKKRKRLSFFCFGFVNHIPKRNEKKGLLLSFLLILPKTHYPFPKPPQTSSLNPQSFPSLPPSPSGQCPSRVSQNLFYSQTAPLSAHNQTSYLDLLNAATTTTEIVTAFKTLEHNLSPSKESLALAWLKASKKIIQLPSPVQEDYQTALDFALRAITVFENSGEEPLKVSEALYILGFASFKLGKLQNSMESLEAAESVLVELESEFNTYAEVKRLSVSVQSQLGKTKVALGQRYNAVSNLRKALMLKGSLLELGSTELADEFKSFAEACNSVLDFPEALSMSLKALEIYESNFGEESLEVVGIRRFLGVVYIGLGESAKALLQYEVAKKVLKRLGVEDLLVEVNIEASRVLIDMSRLDEAINNLKGAVQRLDKESELRALVFSLMAKAMFDQEKFSDAKRCLEISCGILDKKEMESPVMVAETFAEVSMLYEAMSEFEIAMSLMKRTLAILERLPEESHLEGSISARLGWLLLSTGRAVQAVPHLESAVERLQGSFGSKHFGLGFAYKHLGQAYLEISQSHSAIKVLLLAKSIIYACYGVQNQESIEVCQCLANAYGSIGSYNQALDFQQQVVDGWKNHGSSCSDEFREAHRLLEQLKKKAEGSPAAVFPANTLPLPPQR